MWMWRAPCPSREPTKPLSWPTLSIVTGSSADEGVEARIDERTDLLERLEDGDSAVLGELFEHVTGAQVGTVKVTLPAPAARAADR